MKILDSIINTRFHHICMIDSKAIRTTKKILPSAPKVLAYENQVL